MKKLQKGMFFYHKANRSKITVIDFNEKGYPIIRLDIPIRTAQGDKNDFVVTHDSVGEFLFFRESDIDLKTEELAKDESYLQYGNAKLMRLNSDFQKHALAQKGIREIIEHRKIQALIHFTRIENLESILNCGLLSRKEQKKSKVDAAINDELRLDGRLDCISLSISFPNYKLFWSYRNQESGTGWVILKINPDILLSAESSAFYCRANAAGTNELRTRPEKYATAKAFDDMFCAIYKNERGECVRRVDLQISDNYTTNPQAEILIKGIISPKYIAEVVFFESADAAKCPDSFAGKRLIDDKWFSPRHDYMNWKDIK